MTPVLGPTEARLILDLAGLPAFRPSVSSYVVTHRVIAAIPPEHAHYRPEVGARRAAELARHIVGAELRFLGGVAAGTFADFRNIDDAVPDLTDVVSVYEAAFAAALERLATTTGDDPA